MDKIKWFVHEVDNYCYLGYVKNNDVVVWIDEFICHDISTRAVYFLDKCKEL